MIEEFKRNGLGLPTEKRNRLKEIQKRLATIQIQFEKRLNEDKTVAKFTKEDLEGKKNNNLITARRCTMIQQFIN